MTAQSDRLALAAEIEALMEPSREMDARILVALGILEPMSKHVLAGRVFKRGAYVASLLEHWSIESDLQQPCSVEPVTASIDAAYALLPSEWAIDMWHRDGGMPVRVTLITPLDEWCDHHKGRAPTLPLAICAAVVRAWAGRA